MEEEPVVLCENGACLVWTLVGERHTRPRHSERENLYWLDKPRLCGLRG